MTIIAFCGKKRCGKDTAARVALKYGFKQVSFAGKLKQLCADSTNLSIELFTNDQLKDQVLEKPIIVDSRIAKQFIDNIKLFQFTTTEQEKDVFNALNGTSYNIPRDLLKFIGTDVCRNLIDKNIWLNAIRNDLTNGKVVVTDCRMGNERELIKSLDGTLVRVYRDTTDKSLDTHESENNLGSDEEYDVLMYNNGSLVGFLHEVGLWLTFKHF